MARDGCISHPVNQDFFIIRRGYYDLTGENKIQAALLWALEWLTTNRIREMARLRETGEPWIEVTFAELEAEMFGFFSERWMPQAIKALENDGWVKVERPKSPGENSQYLFQIETAQLRLNAWAGQGPEPSANRGGQSSPTSEDSGSREGQTASMMGDKQPPYGGCLSPHIRNIELEEELRSKTSPIILSETSPETPPEKTGSPVDIESPTDKFLTWSTKQRKGRTPWKANAGSAKQLERFCALEETRGLAEARRLFLCYLDSTAPAVSEAKWPMQMFLANPDRNDTADREQPKRVYVQPDLPHMPPANVTPVMDMAKAIAIWDEELPGHTVVWSKRNKAILPGLLDPELTPDVWRTVAVKCRAILDADPQKNSWLSAVYALGEKDGVIRWNRIAAGDYDFLLKGAEKSEVDLAIEQYARENGQ